MITIINYIINFNTITLIHKNRYILQMILYKIIELAIFGIIIALALYAPIIIDKIFYIISSIIN